MKLLLPAAAAAVLWVSAQATSATASRGLESAPPMAGAVETQTVVHDGATRTYRVVAPSNLPEGELAPVVLCFHGAAGTAQDAIDAFGIQDEAQARGWIAVFPEGTGAFSEAGLFLLQTWNAGSCCGFAQQNDVDDVTFFADLLMDLGQRYPVDLDQVCATGMSNGAMMTYRLACERPELLAAVAPVAGSLESGPPTAPIPLLTIFGLLDENVPFAGGVGTGVSGTDFNDQVSSLSAFLAINAARDVQLVHEDETSVAWVAPGGADGAVTAYYLALDGGHTWPGSAGSPLDPTEPVHTTQHATPLMFDFFEAVLGL
jgi:polyhydroxybutyrate depolymerase